MWWRRWRDRDEDLERELRSDLELETEEHREKGLSLEEARYAARRTFGNTTLIKEQVRDMWGWTFLDQLKQDLSYAIRGMRKSPGFTATVVLCLSLGIGANTAIYSMVRAVLLRHLPYRDADSLVAIWEWNREHSRINTVSGGDYADWKARNHVFQDLSYSWDVTYTYTGSGDSEAVNGYTLAPNFFALLGTQPILGRTFRPDDGEHVVAIAYQFWRRRFSGDPRILGRAIKLDGQSYTVIGVMPEGFGYPHLKEQIWTPLILPASFFSGRKMHALRVAARLKPGVTLEQAEVEMEGLARQVETEQPDTNKGMGVHLEPIRDFYTGSVQTMLVVLQCAVLLTLLIACTNVANLLLARASAREREVAVRLALGAGKSRLWRQFLTEGMVLALAGTAGGVFLAYCGVQALTALLPESTAEFAVAAHARAWIDIPVLLATLGLAIAAGLLFGTAPILYSRAPERGALNAGARGLSENAGKVRLRNILVVSQVALSLLLLIGAGLMGRSLLKLFDRQLGFQTNHRLSAVLALPTNRYPDGQKSTAFIQQALAKIAAIKGVDSPAAINTLPLTGMDARRNFTVPGRPESSFAQQPAASFRLVTPTYFRAMGIPLLRGRWFEERDHNGAAGVAIINQTLARQYFPGEDPIGKSISVADGATPVAREIVGVVGDTRDHGFADTPPPEIYRPFYQAYWPFLGIVVRTAGEPVDMTNAFSRAIWSVDREVPITTIVTMDERLEQSIGSRLTNTALLSAFGLIAALLAGLGLYAVIAFSVQKRTQEIGIRMALGARSGDVMAGVLKQALLLTTGGLLIGLPAAFAAARLLRSMLVEVGMADPATFVAFPVMMLVVALFAAYLPARRASRVDPAIALRYE